MSRPGLQCTGVSLAPIDDSPAAKGNGAEELGNDLSGKTADYRQPLHDSNSQPSPPSSQKRSRNTSESIVITPSEKRQTALALSPERPLPAGQQWTTLEVQQVLSLTPGTRPAFRQANGQQSSLDTIQPARTSGSPASRRTSIVTSTEAAPAQHQQPPHVIAI